MKKEFSKVLLKELFPYGINEKVQKDRLYCFHHAGGSALTFKNWLNFQQDIETIPVDVPNRTKQINEQHFNDIVDETVKAILEISNGKKIFIYGHSLGALFSFQVGYKLQKEYGEKVGKIFAAGRPSPHEICPSEFQCSEGQEVLYLKLVQEGLIPEKILKSELFKKDFLPLIFDDYRLREEYTYRGEMVDIPIITLSGDKDTEASKEIMEGWKNVTTVGITQYEIEGNHFFPYGEREDEVLQILSAEITERKETGNAAEDNRNLRDRRLSGKICG
ncbi:MAG: thioesterase domain-containing protein [Muricomes sp.]